MAKNWYSSGIIWFCGTHRLANVLRDREGMTQEQRWRVAFIWAAHKYHVTGANADTIQAKIAKKLSSVGVLPGSDTETDINQCITFIRASQETLKIPAGAKAQ